MISLTKFLFLLQDTDYSFHCLKDAGAGYKEKSIVGPVAHKNIIGIMEALSFYDLTIEIFQTGFGQNIIVMKSDMRNSFLISQYNMNTKKHSRTGPSL